MQGRLTSDIFSRSRFVLPFHRYIIRQNAAGHFMSKTVASQFSLEFRSMIIAARTVVYTNKLFRPRQTIVRTFEGPLIPLTLRIASQDSNIQKKRVLTYSKAILTPKSFFHIFFDTSRRNDSTGQSHFQLYRTNDTFLQSACWFIQSKTPKQPYLVPMYLAIGMFRSRTEKTTANKVYNWESL